MQFWRDVGPDRWFVPGEAFDREIRARFLAARSGGARRARRVAAGSRRNAGP